MAQHKFGGIHEGLPHEHVVTHRLIALAAARRTVSASKGAMRAPNLGPYVATGLMGAGSAF